MSQQPVVPSAVVSGHAQAQIARRRVSEEFNELVGDVKPFSLKSFSPQNYLLKNGFPHVPKYWVQAVTGLSATGEFYAVERQSPRELSIRCHSRFLPGEDLWDDTAGVWRPFYTQGIDYYWVADPAHKPVPQTLDFRVNKEIIDLEVLTFSPGDFLDSSFNEGIDDAVEYTMVVVVSLENPLGFTVVRSASEGIWATEAYQVFSGTRFLDVKTLAHPAQITPAVLVLSVQPPHATLWVITPDRKIFTNTVTNPDMATSHMQFSLGKNLNDVATAYMHVLEFTLFDYAVKDSTAVADRYNIYQLASLYGSVYGAR